MKEWTRVAGTTIFITSRLTRKRVEKRCKPSQSLDTFFSTLSNGAYVCTHCAREQFRFHLCVVVGLISLLCPLCVCVTMMINQTLSIPLILNHSVCLISYAQQHTHNIHPKRNQVVLVVLSRRRHSRSTCASLDPTCSV